MNTHLALAALVGVVKHRGHQCARCVCKENQRVIVLAGLPVHHCRANDAVAETYAMVL